MSRKRFIAFAGIPLLAGLYTYDTANKSVTLVPATVLTVETVVPSAGLDSYQVVMQIADGSTHTSENVDLKPDLTEGASICVSREERSWSAPVFRLTTKILC